MRWRVLIGSLMDVNFPYYLASIFLCIYEWSVCTNEIESMSEEGDEHCFSSCGYLMDKKIEGELKAKRIPSTCLLLFFLGNLLMLSINKKKKESHLCACNVWIFAFHYNTNSTSSPTPYQIKGSPFWALEIVALSSNLRSRSFWPLIFNIFECLQLFKISLIQLICWHVIGFFFFFRKIKTMTGYLRSVNDELCTNLSSKLMSYSSFVLLNNQIKGKQRVTGN